MRAFTRSGVAALLLLAPLATSTAHAEDEKRPMPDYDGRGPPPPDAVDVLLWVPRIILFPPYVVSEYVVRLPLGAFTTWVEEKELPMRIYNFLTFGKDHQAGVIPSALFDFGLLPSVGLYFFWNAPDGQRLRLHAATWGEKWLLFTASDQFKIDDQSTFRLRFEATRRQDLIFYGLGPESSPDAPGRYGASKIEGAVVYQRSFWHTSRWAAELGVRLLSVHDGTCCGDPTIPERVASGDLDLPPGYGDKYTVIRSKASFALDSRDPRPAPGSGVRLEAFIEPSFEPAKTARSWIRYGGALTGFLDLTNQQRILSLSVETDFADPLLEGEVPFTEQISVGGPGLMPGFLPGRLLGQSAAVATLEYQWPVWSFLDGTMHVATGNVFGERLEGFDPKLFRLSTGLGVKTNNERDSAFEILIAIGTEPFSDGARVSSVRFLFGTTHAF